MGWYTVTKKIRGRSYLYRQRSWREGGKVRTECRCLGPVSGGEIANAPAHKRRSIGDNTTNQSEISTSENCQPGGQEDLKYRPALEFHEPGTLAINWDRKPLDIPRNTTKKKFPKGVIYEGDLSAFKISETALAREYDSLRRNLLNLGLRTEDIPRIEIRKGKKTGWRKAWFSKRRYIVTLQEGHRTKFKQAYREALASIFLEELRRQDKSKYMKLRDAVGTAPNRGVRLREVMCELIQKGEKKARSGFEKKRNSRSCLGVDRWHGKEGVGVCDTLRNAGFEW